MSIPTNPAEPDNAKLRKAIETLHPPGSFVVRHDVLALIDRFERARAKPAEADPENWGAAKTADEEARKFQRETHAPIPSSRVVFDGPGANASLDEACAAMDAEIEAAGGLEAWRARPSNSVAGLNLVDGLIVANNDDEGAQAKPAEAVAKVGKFAVHDEHTAFEVLPALYDLPEGDYLLYVSPQPAEVPALRQLLERLSQWDQFNPPMTPDHAFWKREIDAALAPQLALKEGPET